MRRTILAFLVPLVAGAGLVSALEQPRHLDEAIRAQRRLTNAKPNEPGVLNDLGNLLALAGETEQAEEAYRRALELAPDEAIVHYNLGLLLRQMGRPRAALDELKQVVKLDASDAWGHFQLGVLLEEREKTARALDHFVEAFLLEPELAELSVNPQLLDSRLVTRALTLAYTERVALLENAPRQYRQPKRITRLLVPEARRRAAETAEEEEPEGGRKRQRKGRKQAENPSGDS